METIPFIGQRIVLKDIAVGLRTFVGREDKCKISK